MSKGMRELIENVQDFHKACDVPVAHFPSWPTFERGMLRERLLREEFEEELVPAILAGKSLEDIADALADLIYVAVGTAVEFGIPLDRVWAEVHRTNMAKVDPATGKAKHRADGKILKPPGWQPPDIRKALGIATNVNLFRSPPA